jgi:hypothetical protein
MKAAWLLMALLAGAAARAQAPESTTASSASAPGETSAPTNSALATEPPLPSPRESPTARIAATGGAARAMTRSPVVDSLDLGTTSITGTQELHKVLHIVPWKRSDLGDLVGRPANSLLDEVLAPLDPEVFERHVNYYDALYGESDEE